MHPGEIVQKVIHRLEVGGGSRYLRWFLLGLLVILLVLLYDSRAYRNFNTPEAMDMAQLARNLSEGNGYTTLCVRPLSLYLVQSHNQAKYADAPATNVVDFARIKTTHPDLANPPLYPVVLAGLMKVLPFHFAVDLKKPFWSINDDTGRIAGGRRFWRYQPDFMIAAFNEVLLLAVVGLTFFLARRLFDAGVAWVAALLTIGCESLWRFSVSGLSTMMLMVIFSGLVWCVLRIEREAREPEPKRGLLMGLAVTAGVLAGLGALTRYAFGWVIIPVAVFLVLFSGRRLPHVLASVGAFAILLLPWVIRNFVVSGTPFGTAGFAVAEGTGLFPGSMLERSVHPDFSHVFALTLYSHKLLENLRDIVTNVLPRLGGSWASMLFLAGLLLGFRGTAVSRMRYFLLLCLGVFMVVQSLGRTHLSDQSPEVNSENLLVLLVPLVFIYGTAFFFICLGQMKLAIPQLRYVISGAFIAVSCVPMAFTLWFKTGPVAYPPYYPPDIQQTAGWMQENELTMSDVPWAVAWYGQRQCVWLTLNSQDDFEAISYWMKPVAALYLTPETMDGKFVSDWARSGADSWGNFVIQAVTKGQIPQQFPLHFAPAGYLPDRMFLTDRERWTKSP